MTIMELLIPVFEIQVENFPKAFQKYSNHKPNRNFQHAQFWSINTGNLFSGSEDKRKKGAFSIFNF